ncbi:hypothetical protein [Salegentibacter chungangensis]|uniref:hypothetical protein n=1 Tax=Salegentibacter chungangensis TaxID=1335724 RepID=UPI0036D3B948
MNQDQYNRISRQNSEILRQNREIILQNQEIIWANIFHDSIKGKVALEELPLNIGRWAGNYTLFYILFRILNDLKPKRILELGLGESSKFISVFIENYLKNSTHLIIEQDEDWKINFLENFKLSDNSKVLLSPIGVEEVKGKKVNVYTSLSKIIEQKFDFYLIDGPHGSKNFSRFDAYKLAEDFRPEDDFILLIDDYDRQGEKETADLIMLELRKKDIEYYTAEYIGLKSILVISSKRNKKIQNF